VLRRLGLALGRAVAEQNHQLHLAWRAEHAHRVHKARRRTRPGR
jgi:hypothetical protein